MKRAEGIVEILEAFDLTGSFRAAAELAGCSHHTVARYVRLRAAGRVLTERAARDRLIDGFLAKVEEWVERSKGKVRADVVHDKLVALGFEGSERTTRRAVAKATRAYADGDRLVYRPWSPERGMWFQFDWGQGPRIGGRDSPLVCLAGLEPDERRCAARHVRDPGQVVGRRGERRVRSLATTAEAAPPGRSGASQP